MHVLPAGVTRYLHIDKDACAEAIKEKQVKPCIRVLEVKRVDPWNDNPPFVEMQCIGTFRKVVGSEGFILHTDPTAFMEKKPFVILETSGQLVVEE